jgi:hypothetical protein
VRKLDNAPADRAEAIQKALPKYGLLVHYSPAYSSE